MSERPFQTARLSEIEPLTVAGGLAWKPVRRHFGIGAFGVNAYTAAKSGDEVVEDHSELGGGAGRHEELYFVASGHAAFTVAGEEIDAPAGTFVFVRDPAAQRHATAAAPDTTVLVIGGKRGEPFEVSAWEYYFAATPAAEAGDYAEAVRIAAEGLERRPDHPALLYNLACYEALAGQREAAVEHLGRAVGLDPTLGEWSKTDTDLDSIRGDPRFPV